MCLGGSSRSFLIFLTGLLVFASCKDHTTGLPTENLVSPRMNVLTKDNLDSISLSYTAYNTVRIAHLRGTHLVTSDVVSVQPGRSDSTGFHPLAISQSSYDELIGMFRLHFEFTLVFDNTLVSSPLTVRYQFVDSAHADLDTTVVFYKYPYKNAEVFVTHTVTYYGSEHFQDIDIIDNLFFFHPTGPRGLFVHDLSLGETRELIQYASGDAIAADWPFVFCDVSHNTVWRYNLLSDSIDLKFPFVVPGEIAGLETHRGTLLILTYYPAHIRKYSYEGVLLDSIPYPKSTSFITINDSILYSINRGGNLLVRFDLRTRQFLPDLPAPAASGEGIKVRNNRLYYCDFRKRMVGVIPLPDLLSYK